MKLWHKFTEKLPEPYKELILRFNEHGLYKYQSAMAVTKSDYRGEKYLYVEHDLEFTYASKDYRSCEMTEDFRADKEENTEWCYLEDLCKAMEKQND